MCSFNLHSTDNMSVNALLITHMCSVYLHLRVRDYRQHVSIVFVVILLMRSARFTKIIKSKLLKSVYMSWLGSSNCFMLCGFIVTAHIGWMFFFFIITFCFWLVSSLHCISWFLFLESIYESSSAALIFIWLTIFTAYLILISVSNSQLKPTFIFI